MKIAKKKKKLPPLTAHSNTEATELATHCIKGLAMGHSHVLIEMCNCMVDGLELRNKKEIGFICQGNRKMDGEIVKQTGQGLLTRFDAEAMAYCLINYEPHQDPRAELKKTVKLVKRDLKKKR